MRFWFVPEQCRARKRHQVGPVIKTRLTAGVPKAGQRRPKEISITMEMDFSDSVASHSVDRFWPRAYASV
jgi:hypothetical protein